MSLKDNAGYKAHSFLILVFLSSAHSPDSGALPMEDPSLKGEVTTKHRPFTQREAENRSQQLLWEEEQVLERLYIRRSRRRARRVRTSAHPSVSSRETRRVSAPRHAIGSRDTRSVRDPSWCQRGAEMRETYQSHCRSCLPAANSNLMSKDRGSACLPVGVCCSTGWQVKQTLLPDMLITARCLSQIHRTDLSADLEAVE